MSESNDQSSEVSDYNSQQNFDESQYDEEALKEIDRVDKLIEKQNKYAYKLSCEKKYTPSVSKSILDDPLEGLFDEVEEQIDQLIKSAQKFTNFLLNDNQKENTQDEGGYVHISSQPSLLKQITLTNYQVEGLQWMAQLYANGINGILADQMGLGKTISTISLFAYLAEVKNINGPHLIVAPLSTLGNWVNEFKKCFPKCRVVKLQATYEERIETLRYIKQNKFDVIITSFEGVQSASRVLKHYRYMYLVIDEAHKLKNEETLLRKELARISCRNKLLLTGTPLQNNPHELWSLLNFIMPKLFSSSELFDNWFEINTRIAKQDEIQQSYQERNIQLIEKVKIILKPFMLRRTKAEVDLNIPPKKEIHLYLQMTPKQKELYRNIIVDKRLMLEDKSKLNNRLIQLRKICMHPYLFPNVEDPNAPTLGDHLIESSGKMKVLDMFLKKLKKEDHKVLIFSQFTKMLDIIEDYCNYRKFIYCRLDGSTEVSERERYIQEFQDPNSNYFIFMLSTRAGGLGITLTAADTVIIYDSDFNPQIDLQAMDRAHRIGQTKPVNVYRLVCRSTVEEKIIERQQIRLRWEQLVIEQGGRATMGSKLFKREDLSVLASFGASEILKDEPYTEEDIETLLKRGEEQTEKLNEKLDKRFNIIKKETINKVDLGLKQINIWDYFKENNEDVDAIQNQIKQQEREQRQMRILRTSDQTKVKPKFSQLKSEVEVEKFKFYENMQRLQELMQKESDYYLLQQLKDIEATLEIDQDVQPLDQSERKELNKLQQTGFNWNHYEYEQFIRHCEQYGRNNFKEFSLDIGKSLDDVIEYFQVFNQRYKELDDGEAIMEKITKNEKKIEIIKENNQALKEFTKHFQDIKYQNELPLSDKERLSSFNSYHDKLLIDAVAYVGYGNWDEALNYIREDAFFEFDEFLSLLTKHNVKLRINFLLAQIKKINKQQNRQNSQKKSVGNSEEIGETEIIDGVKQEEIKNKKKTKRSKSSKSRRNSKRSKSKGNNQVKQNTEVKSTLLSKKFKIKKELKS